MRDWCGSLPLSLLGGGETVGVGMPVERIEGVLTYHSWFQHCGEKRKQKWSAWRQAQSLSIK